MSTVQQWAQAITQYESGGNPNARNFRNNNPGNLRGTNFAGQVGVDSGGFAIFGTLDAGQAALERDLTAKVSKYPDWSLLDVMRRYLGGGPGVDPPAGEGSAQNYAGYVASQLGVSPDDPLATIFSDSTAG